MLVEDTSDFIYNSSIGIHAVGADGIITYANPFELDMLGYDKDEYVGHHVSEFQKDNVALTDMMKRLGNFEILKNYPSKVQSKSEIIYVLYNSSVYQEEGKFIHTRCFGSQIDKNTYEVLKKNSVYYKNRT